MPVLEPLNNPLWNSLKSKHSHLSIGGDLARRYPASVAPFAALLDGSNAAYDELLQIVEPGEQVGLLTRIVERPSDWTLVKQFEVIQYVWNIEHKDWKPIFEVVPLAEDNLESMLELTALVYPAYFRPGTAKLGEYFGIISEGRLCAMAGIRMALNGFMELSAICTHPGHRGKGYASVLTQHLIHHIRSQGDVPFLHTETDNFAAQSIYEKLGFEKHQVLSVKVLERVY